MHLNGIQERGNNKIRLPQNGGKGIILLDLSSLFQLRSLSSMNVHMNAIQAMENSEVQGFQETEKKLSFNLI